MNSELPLHEQFTAAFYERRAWLAFVILGVNVLVFVMLISASGMPLRWMLVSGNDHAALINFGAKTNFWLLQQRQWFRLVTPIFLHIGLLHLITNSYALWIVGPIVERLYGSTRFAVLYLLTGIAGVAGSLLSVRLNKFDGPTAGASGALFGLFGVLLVVSYKYRRELPETVRRAFGKGVLTVVALNLGLGILLNLGKAWSQHLPLHFVDNWAHVAGLLTGAILAMILPSLAPAKKRQFNWETLVLVLCGLVVGYCFWRAYQLRPFITVR